MSKRKDRERAEAGLVHRNGKLVPKKDPKGVKPAKTEPEKGASFDELRKRLGR